MWVIASGKPPIDKTIDPGITSPHPTPTTQPGDPSYSSNYGALTSFFTLPLVTVECKL
jgi:hypothetical protein